MGTPSASNSASSSLAPGRTGAPSASRRSMAAYSMATISVSEVRAPVHPAMWEATIGAEPPRQCRWSSAVHSWPNAAATSASLAAHICSVSISVPSMSNRTACGVSAAIGHLRGRLRPPAQGRRRTRADRTEGAVCGTSPPADGRRAPPSRRGEHRQTLKYFASG